MSLYNRSSSKLSKRVIIIFIRKKLPAQAYLHRPVQRVSHDVGFTPMCVPLHNPVQVAQLFL